MKRKLISAIGIFICGLSLVLGGILGYIFFSPRYFEPTIVNYIAVTVGSAIIGLAVGLNIVGIISYIVDYSKNKKFQSKK